jgi:hypothetical protein
MMPVFTGHTPALRRIKLVMIIQPNSKFILLAWTPWNLSIQFMDCRFKGVLTGAHSGLTVKTSCVTESVIVILPSIVRCFIFFILLTSVVVDDPTIETRRMLEMPKLYQQYYDQPVSLPNRLALELGFAGAIVEPVNEEVCHFHCM